MANTTTPTSSGATAASAAAKVNIFRKLLQALVELLESLSGKTAFKDMQESLTDMTESMQGIESGIARILEMAEENPQMVEDLMDECIETTQQTLDALSKDGLSEEEMQDIMSKQTKSMKNVSSRLITHENAATVLEATLRVMLGVTDNEEDKVIEEDAKNKPFAIFKTGIDGEECLVAVQDEKKRLSRDAKDIAEDESVSYYVIKDNTFEPIDKSKIDKDTLVNQNDEGATALFNCGNACLVRGIPAIEINGMVAFIFNENADRNEVTKPINDLATELETIDFTSLDNAKKEEFVAKIEKALDVPDKFSNDIIKEKLSMLLETVKSGNLETLHDDLKDLSAQIEKSFPDKIHIDSDKLTAVNKEEITSSVRLADFNGLDTAFQSLGVDISEQMVNVIKNKELYYEAFFDTIKKNNEIFNDEKTGLQFMRYKKDGVTEFRIYNPETQVLIVTNAQKTTNRHTEMYTDKTSINASLEGSKCYNLLGLRTTEDGKTNRNLNNMAGNPYAYEILSTDLASVLIAGQYGITQDKFMGKIEQAQKSFDGIVKKNEMETYMKYMDTICKGLEKGLGDSEIKFTINSDGVEIVRQDSDLHMQIKVDSKAGVPRFAEAEYSIGDDTLKIDLDKQLETHDILKFADGKSKDIIAAIDVFRKTSPLVNQFKDKLKELTQPHDKTKTKKAKEITD